MTNVKLSPLEMELVTDAELILTKNRIIQKVYDLFGHLSNEYRNTSMLFPVEVLAISPKISKGENYQGLPWVMMDYPRQFSKTDVFAVRSFFWWGNFFSITLQLQGKYQNMYADVLNTSLLPQSSNWWYCVSTDDAWEHHFQDDYYKVVHKNIDLKNLPFIKLAKKIPLDQWDNSFDFFKNTYKEISVLLSS